MHTFELTSPKVSISLRFPMQKKVFLGDCCIFDCLLKKGAQLTDTKFSDLKKSNSKTKNNELDKILEVVGQLFDFSFKKNRQGLKLLTLQKCLVDYQFYQLS